MSTTPVSNPADRRPRPRSGLTVDDFKKGEQVVYTPCFGLCEEGVVTSIGKEVVFVRYKATQVHGTATYPRDLFKPHQLEPRQASIQT